MKIVNETVYNSDGIYNLLIKVYNACDAANQERIERTRAQAAKNGRTWEPNHWHLTKPLPEAVVIGYGKRSAKSTKNRYSGEPWTTLRDRYTQSPRIGIVKPDNLPLNALVVLAHCAEGAHRALPHEVVESIARTFARTQPGRPSDECIREIVEETEISFALKPKRGSRKEVAAARRKVRVTRLESRIADYNDDIERLRLRIWELEQKRDAAQEKLDNLQQKRKAAQDKLGDLQEMKINV